jgi:hypothetical protein
MHIYVIILLLLQNNLQHYFTTGGGVWIHYLCSTHFINVVCPKIHDYYDDFSEVLSLNRQAS